MHPQAQRLRWVLENQDPGQHPADAVPKLFQKKPPDKRCMKR